MSADITMLLQAVASGDESARNQLFESAYDNLKLIARRQRRHGSAATLQTTALVHEAYLKLVAADAQDRASRAHFFAASARAMRQIVVDHYRRKTADKRGGDEPDYSLNTDDGAVLPPDASVLALDAALEQLAGLDPRLARLVEYRFFAGMTQQEIAEATGLTDRTIRSDWVKAKALLSRLLEDGS